MFIAKKYIPYYDDFIKSYSDNYQKKIKNMLIYYLLYIVKEFKKCVLFVDPTDILNFFRNDIETRDIQRDAKLKWYHVINQYYKHVEFEIEDKDGSS